jgi:hypothetical protein
VSALSTELLGAACVAAERLIVIQIPILFCISCLCVLSHDTAFVLVVIAYAQLSSSVPSCRV